MIDELRFKAESEEQVLEAIKLCKQVGRTVHWDLTLCNDWDRDYWGFYLDGEFGQPYRAVNVVSFDEWMKTVKEHYNVEEKDMEEVKESSVRITRVEFDGGVIYIDDEGSVTFNSVSGGTVYFPKPRLKTIIEALQILDGQKGA